MQTLTAKRRIKRNLIVNKNILVILILECIFAIYRDKKKGVVIMEKEFEVLDLNDEIETLDLEQNDEIETLEQTNEIETLDQTNELETLEEFNNIETLDLENQIEFLDEETVTKDKKNLKRKKKKDKGKKKSFIKKAVDFFLMFTSSFFIFFINFALEIAYNVIIFIPFLFGKREFPNVRKDIEHLKKYPEVFMLMAMFTGSFVVIFNFVYPHSPFRVTKVPEQVEITKETEDDDSTKQDTTNSESADNNSNSSSSTSLYKKYQNADINDISITKLKKENSDTVAWLRVDQTNINYPVVQTSDNDYYIDHSFTKAYNKNGWVFGDYRNDWSTLKKNTIIYGHHLLNQAMFGSISKMFTADWQNNSNHLIVTKTESATQTWQIFSVYEIPTEIYYLANEFTTEEAYRGFVSTLQSRTIYNFNVDTSNTSNILTLSTCNDENTGRLVVHAALIQTQ